MAHHRLAHDNSAAIFSPSVARIAAATARDWSYVESWLASKFPGRSVPPFERNQGTLKALLALAAANEAADEERRLVADTDAEALQELRQRAMLNGGDPARQASPRLALREDLLSAIEDSLPKEGTAAVSSLARMAVIAGMAFPEPEHLARSMISLQASIYEAEQTAARVDILNHHIQTEATRAQDLLQSLRSDHYVPPANSAKKNLDLQRRVKTLSANLPDLQDRPAASATSITSANMSHPTVDQVIHEERDYLDLLARKKELDAQMAVFQGLPSDPDMARLELDDRRRELQEFTSHRDEVFEGLVERESPVKRR